MTRSHRAGCVSFGAFGGPIPVPAWWSVDRFAVAVAIVTFVGRRRYRWNVVPVVLASAVAGLIYTLVK